VPAPNFLSQPAGAPRRLAPIAGGLRSFSDGRYQVELRTRAEVTVSTNLAESCMPAAWLFEPPESQYMIWDGTAGLVCQAIPSTCTILNIVAQECRDLAGEGADRSILHELPVGPEAPCRTRLLEIASEPPRYCRGLVPDLRCGIGSQGYRISDQRANWDEGRNAGQREGELPCGAMPVTMPPKYP